MTFGDNIERFKVQGNINNILSFLIYFFFICCSAVAIQSEINKWASPILLPINVIQLRT